MILLDTNVVSEWASPRPSEAVRDWLNALDEDETYVSAVSIAEIARGVDRLRAGRRKDALAEWLRDGLLPRFDERCLPVDAGVALEWARLVGDGDRTGRPIEAFDALIGATARAHGLALATRNTRHFVDRGITLLDPWST